jgi:hypothetical protein
LNEVAVNGFYAEADYYTWHEMRLLAVDGTRLVLPNHPSVIEEFGQHKLGPDAESKRSLALGSMLYDVLNQITLAAQIAPYGANERDLLCEHLDKTQPGDLLLLDRGYPSFWLLFLLKARELEFCVRIKEDWLQVKDFAQSKEQERIVSFFLPKRDAKKLADYPHMVKAAITCRLVKIELPNGEKEILCTSLVDQEKYLHEEFEELYHYRWNEEEAYKLLKNRVEIEQFSGKTARAVKQDFFAKIFLMTLCAAYAHPIEDKVRAEYQADQDRQHPQKINRTNALSMTRDIIIPILLRKQFAKALRAFDQIVRKTREIIRPGRSEPRNERKRKRYSMNYKPL